MALKFDPKFHPLIRSSQKTQTRRPVNGKPPKWVPGEVYDLPDVGVRVLCERIWSDPLKLVEHACGLIDEGYLADDPDGYITRRNAALRQFRADWDSFYGEGAFALNPLVWVYSFKVIGDTE